MFKTRRQQRYNKLKQYGFLPFEAKELSKIPFKIPYWKAGIKARISALKGSLAAKQSYADYVKTVLAYYQRHDWLKPETNKPDPWAMLRNWAERYRDKHPEYESPWQKKPRKRSSFTKKFDRGEQKYPRGRAYRR